ncbi:LuxR family transcriptional regulator [Kribbella sp. VKM Ac-2568]|uniref:helix-turn-helix transcriptional regulator n=1 Tax=Kribbella sp. VKM Ac-2568 TaxID=2512219 RepID=UPI00104620DE|nr:LuxR family transcriptional regulator [Kribbella sp. VKM Ac-2568]TCM44529.1 regulatory LuxR family protein [Kribbella sp. VKM Ac-2568]
MPNRDAGTRLLGRRSECDSLDRLLVAARIGQSRVLVLRGEAGVGKTALLEYLSARSQGFRIVRVAGVQSEMEFAFAGLHQLCAPLLDRLDRLPAPQQEALAAAFGLTAGKPPDRSLVALAVLGLLAEASADQPLLCLVDDAQWMDGTSSQAIGFLARRLVAEPIALVIVVREPSSGPELAELPELRMSGLGDADARTLLASVVKGPLDDRVRDRIVAETRGNPLALVELPRAWTTAELADGFGVHDRAALSGRVEEGFLRRFQPLPSDTRRLLLTAAAEPLGDATLLWRAADRLGLGTDAAASAAAEASGLIELGRRVRFRHPLVRSAVYEAASPEERQTVHLALAEVTDPDADPDRRAWHLAAAAPGPDETVAADLERSAGRAQARGGFSAAAAFLQRAVTLTQEPVLRAERALAAAQASLQAGAFLEALQLLEVAETGVLDELEGARVDMLRGEIAFASRVGGDATPLLLKAAKRLEPLDLDLAREVYLNSWGAAVLAGSASQLREVSAAARALPPRPGDQQPTDLLLDGLASLTIEGQSAAAPVLLRASSAFADGEVSLEEGLRWGWLAAPAGMAIWDVRAWQAIYERQIQVARDTGALEQLPIYLASLGTATAWSGDFRAAEDLIAEADQFAAATGTPAAPFAALLLLALRGWEPDASALIQATIDQATDGGPGVVLTRANWVAAVLYNGLGRYDDALAAAERAASDEVELFSSMWALPELVEAAVHSRRFGVARAALDRLTSTTRPAGTDFGLGLEARSRALLSDGDTAEDLYIEAIDRLSRTHPRPEVARAHLLYGEWLRREGRRVDARERLRIAYDLLTTIGMEAFAERARRELLATGETVRKRTRETKNQLTAQESQIARLARDGFSNPEIATRLFISPRTVEWHLRKVFTKLGIRSRRDLTDATLDNGPG